MNPDCTAKQLKKFARFVSKPGMDIDGISEATIARFINEGWIRSAADIFRIPAHKAELAELDGFGEKSAANIEASVEKARTVSDEKLLYALNIPLIGQDVAKRLLSAYSIEELLQKAQETDDPAVFASIDGIGPEKSGAFVVWAKEEKNAANLQDLLSEIHVTREDRAPQGEKCKDLTFVVTGDVFTYKNRNELKAYIESQGGKVTGSVSKSTDYLINNDVNSTSSKYQKAHQLNVPIISETEFNERFGA